MSDNHPISDLWRNENDPNFVASKIVIKRNGPAKDELQRSKSIANWRKQIDRVIAEYEARMQNLNPSKPGPKPKTP